MTRRRLALLVAAGVLAGAALRVRNLNAARWRYGQFGGRGVELGLLGHGYLVSPAVCLAWVLGLIFSLYALTLAWFLIRKRLGTGAVTYAAIPLVSAAAALVLR